MTRKQLYARAFDVRLEPEFAKKVEANSKSASPIVLHVPAWAAEIMQRAK